MVGKCTFFSTKKNKFKLPNEVKTLYYPHHNKLQVICFLVVVQLSRTVCSSSPIICLCENMKCLTRINSKDIFWYLLLEVVIFIIFVKSDYSMKWIDNNDGFLQFLLRQRVLIEWQDPYGRFLFIQNLDE